MRRVKARHGGLLRTVTILVTLAGALSTAAGAVVKASGAVRDLMEQRSRHLLQLDYLDYCASISTSVADVKECLTIVRAGSQ